MLSEYAQKVKGFHVDRMDHLDEESGEWNQMVVEDRTATPADVACTRVDFGEWLRTLSNRERMIAETLATGETTGGTAKKFDISSGRVSQLRRELFERWRAFQGEAA